MSVRNPPTEPIGLLPRLLMAIVAVLVLGAAIALRWHHGERGTGGVHSPGASPDDYRPIRPEPAP